MSFAIRGTGSCVPSFVLDNDGLSAMVDTSDEWIVTRTGIRQRRICTTESMEMLAGEAALAALAMANVAPTDVDLILCATIQGDYITPSLACTVQRYIGATCPAMDINAACSGFIYALDVAAGYFARGHVRHVLVIAAECMSKHVDWTERSTCVLFGDGAGAVLLGPGDGLRSTCLTAEGGEALLNIPGVQSTFPMAAPASADGRSTIYMNGQQVYRFAVKAMCSGIRDALEKTKTSMAQIRYVLVHQANRRILDAAQERLGIPDEKMVYGVDRYGNTSSSSIPILLDELQRAGRLQPGDLVALCAFGGGLTAGAAVLSWG